jgi:hypothetical protein
MNFVMQGSSFRTDVTMQKARNSALEPSLLNMLKTSMSQKNGSGSDNDTTKRTPHSFSQKQWGKSLLLRPEHTDIHGQY